MDFAAHFYIALISQTAENVQEDGYNRVMQSCWDSAVSNATHIAK